MAFELALLMGGVSCLVDLLSQVPGGPGHRHVCPPLTLLVALLTPSRTPQMPFLLGGAPAGSRLSLPQHQEYCVLSTCVHAWPWACPHILSLPQSCKAGK